MNDLTKNILLGLFVVAASAIIIFVLLFLHPTVGDDGETIRVRFANVDKISIGTRVTYGGKAVGEVVEIKSIEDPAHPRVPGKEGYVYLYELILSVDSKVRIYNTDQVSSRTSGLLGEKSVEITPRPLQPGQKLKVVSGEVIYAEEGGTVEETLKEFKQLSDKIDSALGSFQQAMDELNKSKLWQNMGTTAENLKDITTALNVPDKWYNSLQNIETFTHQMNAFADQWTLTGKQWNETGRQWNEAGEKATTSLSNLDAVTANIREGRGTLGGIIMKDDIYLRTASIMGKAETILDDINHFGLLYQNDKRWQRLRARRANLITRLSSPQEFRNYFNDELDEITTSLARISMVMQETECADDYQAFMDDAEFRKVFAELLRRVNTMEESLKWYNQQVVERDTMQTELQGECE